MERKRREPNKERGEANECVMERKRKFIEKDTENENERHRVI